jgi:hypothetical protein
MPTLATSAEDTGSLLFPMRRARDLPQIIYEIFFFC